MLLSGQTWRSGLGGLLGQEKPFPPSWGAGKRTAVKAAEDGPPGEGEDALSRKEFTECCPLIWSQPHTHTHTQSF